MQPNREDFRGNSELFRRNRELSLGRRHQGSSGEFLFRIIESLQGFASANPTGGCHLSCPRAPVSKKQAYSSVLIRSDRHAAHSFTAIAGNNSAPATESAIKLGV